MSGEKTEWMSSLSLPWDNNQTTKEQWLQCLQGWLQYWDFWIYGADENRTAENMWVRIFILFLFEATASWVPLLDLETKLSIVYMSKLWLYDTIIKYTLSLGFPSSSIWQEAHPLRSNISTLSLSEVCVKSHRWLIEWECLMNTNPLEFLITQAKVGTLSLPLALFWSLRIRVLLVWCEEPHNRNLKA